MNNFEQAKAQHDLLAYITRATGQTPQRCGNNLYRICCPFHQEHTPSFMIYTDSQRFMCFGACKTSGDIVDFVQRFHNIATPYLALEYLSGQSITQQQPHTPLPRQESKPQFNWQTVERAQKFGIPAWEYFSKRGLNADTITKHKLGASFETIHVCGTRVESKRYTIPHFFYDNLFAINTRLDTSYCEEQLQDSALQARLAERYDTHSMATWIREIFGPKYRWMLGSHPKIYNAERLVKKCDNEYVPRSLDCVLITEAEICCMLLEQHGYPATSAKFSRAIDFKRAYQNVRVPVIAADNGEAGHELALRLRGAIGRGLIIYPPPEYKDPGEVALDGELYRWLYKQGIEPQL